MQPSLLADHAHTRRTQNRPTSFILRATEVASPLIPEHSRGTQIILSQSLEYAEAIRLRQGYDGQVG